MSEFPWVDDLRDPRVRDELDRLHPERTKLRPTDVDGLIEAFDVVDAIWAPTIARARRLPPARLHERVDGEFSFVETLRHLLFAMDAWVTRMVLGVPNAYHAWSVPPDLASDAPADTGPDLDSVLEVRAERMAGARGYLSKATQDDLLGMVSPPDPSGFPQGQHRVLSCLHVVLNEEWWHHRYAARDLAVLERRYPPGPHGGEIAGLEAWLRFHQDALLRKVHGLSDVALRQSPVPTGTNLLGLVKHVAYVHDRWFGVCLLGEPAALPAIARESEFVVGDEETVDDVLDLYRREVDRSRSILAGLDPDQLNRGSHPSGNWGPGDFDARWVLLHLIEELARHNGHADILRELIDGQTGK